MTQNDNEYHLFYLNDGVQAQAGKPFYHKRGPLQMIDEKVVDNACLCKYPCKRWYPVYQKLVPGQVEIYGSSGVQTAAGYKWEVISGGTFGNPYNTYYIGTTPPATPGKWIPLQQLPYNTTGGYIGASTPSPEYPFTTNLKETVRVMYVSDYRCEGNDPAAQPGTVCAGSSPEACGEILGDGSRCDCGSQYVGSRLCYCARLYYNQLTPQKDPQTGVASVTSGGWIDYQYGSGTKPEIPEKMKFPFDVCMQGIGQQPQWGSGHPFSKLPKDIYYQNCARAWKWDIVDCHMGHSQCSLLPLPRISCAMCGDYTYDVQGNCWWYYSGIGGSSYYVVSGATTVCYSAGTPRYKYCTISGGTIYNIDNTPAQCGKAAVVKAPLIFSTYTQQYAPDPRNTIPFYKQCSCSQTVNPSAQNFNPPQHNGFGVDPDRAPCNEPKPSQDVYITVDTDDQQLYKAYRFIMKKSQQGDCRWYTAQTGTGIGQQITTPGWQYIGGGLTQLDVVSNYIINGKLQQDRQLWYVLDSGSSTVPDQAQLTWTKYITYKVLRQDDPTTAVDIPVPAAWDTYQGCTYQMCQQGGYDSRIQYLWYVYWWCYSYVPEEYPQTALTLWNGLQGPSADTGPQTKSTICTGWQRGPQYDPQHPVDQTLLYTDVMVAQNPPQHQPKPQPHRGLITGTRYFYRVQRGKTNPCLTQPQTALAACTPTLTQFWQMYDGCITPLSKRQHSYAVKAAYTCHNGNSFNADTTILGLNTSYCDYQLPFTGTPVQLTTQRLPALLAHYLMYKAAGTSGIPSGAHINTWGYWYDGTTYRYPFDHPLGQGQTIDNNLGYNTKDNALAVKTAIQLDTSAQTGGGCQEITISDTPTLTDRGLRYFYTLIFRGCSDTGSRKADGQPITQYSTSMLGPVCIPNKFYAKRSAQTGTDQCPSGVDQVWPPYSKPAGHKMPAGSGGMGDGQIQPYYPYLQVQIGQQGITDWRIDQWVKNGSDSRAAVTNTVYGDIQMAQPRTLPASWLYQKLIEVTDFCGQPAAFQQLITGGSVTYTGDYPSIQCGYWYPFKVTAYLICSDSSLGIQKHIQYSTEFLPAISLSLDPSAADPTTQWTASQQCGDPAVSRIYTMNAQRSYYGGSGISWWEYPANGQQWNTWRINAAWSKLPQYKGPQPDQTLFAAMRHDMYVQQKAYAYSAKASDSSLSVKYTVQNIRYIPHYICSNNTAVQNPQYIAIAGGTYTQTDVSWSSCKVIQGFTGTSDRYGGDAFWKYRYKKIQDNTACVNPQSLEYSGSQVSQTMKSYLCDYLIQSLFPYVCQNGQLKYDGTQQQQFGRAKRFYAYNSSLSGCWEQDPAGSPRLDGKPLNTIVWDDTTTTSRLYARYYQVQRVTYQKAVSIGNTYAHDYQHRPDPSTYTGCWCASSAPSLAFQIDWSNDPYLTRDMNGSTGVSGTTTRVDTTTGMWHFDGPPGGADSASYSGYGVHVQFRPLQVCKDGGLVTTVTQFRVTVDQCWYYAQGGGTCSPNGISRLVAGGTVSFVSGTATSVNCVYECTYGYPSGDIVWAYCAPGGKFPGGEWAPQSYCYPTDICGHAEWCDNEIQHFITVKFTWSSPPSASNPPAPQVSNTRNTQTVLNNTARVVLPQETQSPTDIQYISVNSDVLQNASPQPVQQLTKSQELQQSDSFQYDFPDLPLQYMTVLKGDK